MQRPRLVACDVDGTLLDPLERVSQRTRDVGHRLVGTGTPFVLATGRPPRWIPTVVDAIGLPGYAVCCNGAVLYDAVVDQVVCAKELDPVLLRDVADALHRALPGSFLGAERAGSNARRPDGPVFVTESGYTHPWADDDPMTAPRAELLGLPAVKLLIRHEAMTSEEMAVAASAVVGDAVDVTFSIGVGLIEVSVPGVSKANGLAEVIELFGVRREDVIAFGDMPNDLSMLRWAGHSVAMGNAHPDVLAVADEVTTSNAEDGVAQVLERWF
ncbi:MAG: HAD family hydrolase [Sciscionella sp.]